MESSRSVSDGNQVSRPTAADGSPCQSTGRIPAQVFAPASATAQAEWSSASNESLFSIHIGNMSFNDRLSSMSKSGELDSTIISSPLFEFPVISTENVKKSGGEDGCGSVNLGRSMSQLSDASAKSFAFPM
ncbi:hypothetical protein HRI_005044300 [Hibiscus trionum]|uniref:Uncharacterized protein n=1 Tax=Hibiscus trionum TaxID=183268 RepID=A0A9W7MX70_HIBTR|nr:hypothetical protein HRI_005044300 [Hibiscus trionum]